MIDPNDFYTDKQRDLQKQHDSHKLANVVVASIVSEELQDPQIAFISSRDYFFLSSVNSSGEPTVSYKGGPVGFVKVQGSRTLIFPNFDGNGMFYSMGNISETGKIGMLFIDMETPNRVRVQGTAKTSDNPEFVGLFPGANMVAEVGISSVFYNCARYIHKHKRISDSEYIPDENGKQPYPAWKRIDDVQDALPTNDQNRATDEGGIITYEEYVEKLEKGTS